MHVCVTVGMLRSVWGPLHRSTAVFTRDVHTCTCLVTGGREIKVAGIGSAGTFTRG